MALGIPPPLPFPPVPVPVPVNPEYGVWDDHTCAGRTTPSEGPRTDTLVESKREPGGVGVDVGACESPEVGDVVECVCVCVCWGVDPSAGTYTPPSSVLPSGESVCRRSLTRSVPAP
jgi:hypothetical protein